MPGVQVKRYYRPGDIDEAKELKSDFWEIYSTDEHLEIKPEDIVRKCYIQGTRAGQNKHSRFLSDPCFVLGNEQDTFICTKSVEIGENGQKTLIDLEKPGSKAEEVLTPPAPSFPTVVSSLIADCLLCRAIEDT